jgi:phosphate transport system substrate-binding protein
MKRIFPLLMLAVLIASCNLPKEDTPTSGKLHGMTCESQATVMQRQIEQFQSLYADTKVTLTVTSTRDAIVQFLNDSVRFICVDRALNKEERDIAKKAELEFNEFAVAEDALAFIVNESNPAQRLSQQSIRDIVSGSVTDWKNVPESGTQGNIQLIMTGRNSGPYELMTKHFLRFDGDARLAAIADSQRATAQLVASHPQALGIVPVSVLRDSLKLIRPLEVEYIDTTSKERSFVKLHQANIYLGRYPYHFPVYVYVRAGDHGVASGLGTFIASTPGQKIFQNAGLVPKTMPVRLVKLNEE